MDGKTKVPYSQLLINLSKNQISVTEASEYVDHLKEFKRSLDTQYLLVDKDVIHANDKLQIADQRQQLSLIGRQKLMYLKVLLKDKKQDLKEKLASEVEKTNQWKKEIQLILSKHETTFNQRKAKYNMHPLAQQRQETENEYKQVEIMVNIQTTALEDTKKKFYKFTQILEQMSRLHTVQMAKAYILCHQAMKRKLELAVKLRNEKQELEKLKQQKENIFKDGLKIKSLSVPQVFRSTGSKQAFDHLSHTDKPSPGTTGSRGLSPRITLDNIPRLQLPEWQGTPPKMPCLSSFTGTSYGFSSPLSKTLTNRFSLFKSNPLRSVTNTNDNILKGFGEKKQQSSQEQSPLMKQNEISTVAASAVDVEVFQSSPMDTESSSSAKPAGNTTCDQNSTHESEVQDLNVSREKIIENCSTEDLVLSKNSEKERDSSVNTQENMPERDLHSNESQDNPVPIRKWKKISPEYHLKAFSISSATKLNAKQNNDKSPYFEKNTLAESTNSINVQEKEQVNRELSKNITEHEVPKESEEKPTGAVAVPTDKDLQNSDDCMPCTPMTSPTECSNSSGAALTAYDLSPNSYSGTDGYQSPNMDRWSPTNNSPEAANGSSQQQVAEGINIFDGTSISSNQAFSLAFDFGSSTITSSTTTMLFGENEGGKQTSKDPKKKDDGGNFSFGFQPVFKMF